jgi:hypothetical protein
LVSGAVGLRDPSGAQQGHPSSLIALRLRRRIGFRVGRSPPSASPWTAARGRLPSAGRELCGNRPEHDTLSFSGAAGGGAVPLRPMLTPWRDGEQCVATARHRRRADVRPPIATRSTEGGAERSDPRDGGRRSGDGNAGTLERTHDGHAPAEGGGGAVRHQGGRDGATRDSGHARLLRRVSPGA